MLGRTTPSSDLRGPRLAGTGRLSIGRDFYGLERKCGDCRRRARILLEELLVLGKNAELGGFPCEFHAEGRTYLRIGSFPTSSNFF